MGLNADCSPMPHFARYLGIDYSGAQTSTSSLTGLRLYAATPAQPPAEIPPPPSPRKYWTRRGLAEWLVAELRDGPPTLIGIDHAFSFPLRYFEVHRLPPDWPAFLDDFQHHWPTDGDHLYVDFIRDGLHGDGAARTGDSRWRRMTEERSRAKSVFHFDVQGSVAKSTHAGLPWLRNPHQHDAYSVARRMQQSDATDTLPVHFHPQLRPSERTLAQLEGWILGLA